MLRNSKRKLFKQGSIITIISFLLILALIFFMGCVNRLTRSEESREKMGTYVSIIFYSNADGPQGILSDGFDEIDRLSKISSNYDPESSVSVLNSEGHLNNAPVELVELMSLSKQYNKISNGAFDITIDPILTLWAEGLWQESEEVQNQTILEALKRTGSDKILIEGNNISFAVDGMSVTLGGIAKGYIVDKVMAILTSYGIKNALVNAGGDIATLGKKPDGEKWIVNLENPDNTDEKIITFGLSGEAVATSGNYYRYFDPEKEVHHIIDPKTGFSANKCISATIIAENATIADILSTSVFVLGPVDGMKLVEGLKGVEALIIDNERNITHSSGLSDFIMG